MKDITKLHPKLQKKLQLLIQKCKEQGLEVQATETYRTVIEQDALYAKGRTAPGNIVTNAKGSSYSSMHQWGVAVDFCRKDGKPPYENSDQFFEKVGNTATAIGLEWGGNWKLIKDKPHLQLIDWGSTPQRLKELYKTPEAFMQSWAVTSLIIPDDNFKRLIMNLQSAVNSEYEKNLKVDGIPGQQTLEAMPTLNLTLCKNKRLLTVKCLQELLNWNKCNCGQPDGYYGSATDQAVRLFQTSIVKMQKPDGEFTAQGISWKSILRL